MEIVRSLEEAGQLRGPSVVTIGSFDGIHLAHLELLRRIRRIAQEKKAASVAVTFYPHPVQVLAPQRAPQLLTPLSARIGLFEKSGIDRLLILPFTKEFSYWSPEKFVDEVLRNALRALLVVIGDNFHFGHQQAGTPKVMEELGRRYGFRTEIVPQMTVRNRTVSSSEIRRLLWQGRLAQANRLLGRCFTVRSRIESGLGIGRRETVPTLNLARYSGALPAAGVYITWTRLGAGQAASKLAEAAGNAADESLQPAAPLASRLLRSITNVGTRPTFGEREFGVETHLLEPWEGPSPAEMEVSFLYRLRDERRFASPEQLKTQIMKDIRRAESYFRRLQRFGAAARVSAVSS